MTHMSWYQRVVLFMRSGCNHTNAPYIMSRMCFVCSDCGATRQLFEDWQAPSIKEGDK